MSGTEPGKGNPSVSGDPGESSLGESSPGDDGPIARGVGPDGDHGRDQPAEATAEPIDAPARFTGRATPRTFPNRGRLLDDSPEFDDDLDDLSSVGYDVGRRRVPAPLIIGAALAVVIAATVEVILYTSSDARCPAGTCRALGTSSAGRTSPGHTPATATTPAIPSATPRRVVGTVPPLASVMPADLNLKTCRTKDNQPFLENVTAFFACQEGAAARIPYLQVWGYQFADAAAYQQGIGAFNVFVKFDPDQAEGKCPPALTYGSVGWHTLASPSAHAGTLECYSDTAENHYYVWTDDLEYTIIVAESGPEHAFADLDAWWRHNNRNA